MIAIAVLFVRCCATCFSSHDGGLGKAEILSLAGIRINVPAGSARQPDWQLRWATAALFILRFYRRCPRILDAIKPSFKGRDCGVALA